jgi:hypothetical protein
VSKHDDHAVFIPIRFYDAFDLGEVTQRQFDLGVRIARRCYDVRNTSDGWAVVRLTPLAEEFDVSEEAIRLDLHARLTGLASPARPPQHLQDTSKKEHPDIWRLTSTSDGHAVWQHEQKITASVRNARRKRYTGPRDETRDETTRTRDETKWAPLTTEFWAMLVLIGAILAAAAISDSLDDVRAWTLVTIVGAAYIVSRGFAKIGTDHLAFRARQRS